MTSVRTTEIVANVLHEFRRHRQLAERAMRQLTEDDFFLSPSASVNSVAVIVKHLAGNLQSRWAGFLVGEGDQPNRKREKEFEIGGEDTREALMARWECGWQGVLDAVDALSDADFGDTILIREERHTALQATLRGLTHATYHVGQILYAVRQINPEGQWITIPPGQGIDNKQG